MSHYDVMIIGTGAGGGTLAYALASTGKKILLLDRGYTIPNEDDNWNPKSLYMDGKYQTDESWIKHEIKNRKKHKKSLHPALYHRVGGNTKVYGGALFRMRPEDFQQTQHREGISPEWCLSYEDLEPYYTQAESLYKVHGQRGIDPTEPPTAAPYPFVPLPHTDRIQQVSQQLQQQGLHPFPLPMAIDYQPQKPNNSCILCGTCDGYPCKINYKADAQICCVEPALKYPNVTLIQGAQVEKLMTNAAGTAITEVEVILHQPSRSSSKNPSVQLLKRERFSADFVIVSCGAVNSAALLLRSASGKHPEGLANRSGQVGRQLMRHNLSKLYAIGLPENKSVFQKTLGINDFYRSSEIEPYPLGHIHLMGKHTWEMMRPDFPSFIPQGILEQWSKHSIDWWVQSEDLPNPNNRVSVDRNGVIHIEYQPNNLQSHRRLKKKFKSILRRIGLPLILDVEVPFKVLNHQVGTCRFGNDPNRSVLDRDCRAHDLDNLYVVDASFFPSSAAINPSLTIIANALRVAEHLRERLMDPSDKVYADKTLC